MNNPGYMIFCSAYFYLTEHGVIGVCLEQTFPHSSNRISRSISIKAIYSAVNYNASTIIGIILQLRGTTVGVF